MSTIILFGGRSDERHVSVASAQNLARIVSTPLCWFWAPNGAIHDVGIDELVRHRDPFDVDYVPSRPAIWPDLEQALDTLPVEDPLFLLALHGGEGENGTVQRMMEARSIAFTGSGSAASAAAFDKGKAKEIVGSHVRIADASIADRPSDLQSTLEAMLARHERVVLKPVAGGSSRGLFFVSRHNDVAAAAAQAAALGVPYVVEEFFPGRELTVGVVDRGDGPLALPVLEIEVDPGHAFDYAGKYHGKGTREICPANIGADVREEAQRIAVTAHKLLGCEGYSRSDLIAFDGGVLFLELNTLPGLTTSSLVPQQLRVAGIDMKTFVDEQLAIAAHRYESVRA